jgi:hypothetical protein
MDETDTCRRITHTIANGATTFCGKPAVSRTVTGTLLCKEHDEQRRWEARQATLRRQRAEWPPEDAMRWRPTSD